MTDHDWRNSEDGWAELVSKPSPGSGLFYTHDEIEVTCPRCGASMLFAEPGAETDAILEGIQTWRVDREGASFRCLRCQKRSPLQWRSNRHWFAAGHLGITLWRGIVSSLVETPASPEATALRRLFGDVNDDFAVVFRHV